MASYLPQADPTSACCDCSVRGSPCDPCGGGACCVDHTCEDLSAEDCVAAGGVFHAGPGCGDNDMPCPGSCCYPDGSCADGVNHDDCAAASGHFNGAGYSCGDHYAAPNESLIVACCPSGYHVVTNITGSGCFAGFCNEPSINVTLEVDIFPTLLYDNGACGATIPCCYENFSPDIVDGTHSVGIIMRSGYGPPASPAYDISIAWSGGCIQGGYVSFRTGLTGIQTFSDVDSDSCNGLYCGDTTCGTFPDCGGACDPDPCGCERSWNLTFTTTVTPLF